MGLTHRHLVVDYRHPNSVGAAVDAALWHGGPVECVVVQQLQVPARTHMEGVSRSYRVACYNGYLPQ